MSASSNSLAPRAAFPIVPIIIGMALVAALIMALLVAPREREMGEVQRIFYFHVGSAFAALIGWVGCALASIAYLILASRKEQQVLANMIDRVAHGLAEVGVLFGVIVLVTGPLWAKPVWKTYWTWEPRLVLMMLTQFLFMGYVILRGYAKRDSAGKKLAAGIAIIGGPAVYLIHVAVELWGGNHPSVVNNGGLKTELMQISFWSAVAAVMLFAGYLVYLRVQHHKFVDDLEEGFLEVADHEDQGPSPDQAAFDKGER